MAKGSWLEEFTLYRKVPRDLTDATSTGGLSAAGAGEHARGTDLHGQLQRREPQ